MASHPLKLSLWLERLADSDSDIQTPGPPISDRPSNPWEEIVPTFKRQIPTDYPARRAGKTRTVAAEIPASGSGSAEYQRIVQEIDDGPPQYPVCWDQSSPLRKSGAIGPEGSYKKSQRSVARVPSKGKPGHLSWKAKRTRDMELSSSRSSLKHSSKNCSGQFPDDGKSDEDSESDRSGHNEPTGGHRWTLHQYHSSSNVRFDSRPHERRPERSPERSQPGSPTRDGTRTTPAADPHRRRRSTRVHEPSNEGSPARSSELEPSPEGDLPSSPAGSRSRRRGGEAVSSSFSIRNPGLALASLARHRKSSRRSEQDTQLTVTDKMLRRIAVSFAELRSRIVGDGFKLLHGAGLHNLSDILKSLAAIETCAYRQITLAEWPMPNHTAPPFTKPDLINAIRIQLIKLPTSINKITEGWRDPADSDSVLHSERELSTIADLIARTNAALDDVTWAVHSTSLHKAKLTSPPPSRDVKRVGLALAPRPLSADSCAGPNTHRTLGSLHSARTCT